MKLHNHHKRAARVQVYHGRYHIIKQKKNEKPKRSNKIKYLAKNQNGSARLKPIQSCEKMPAVKRGQIVKRLTKKASNLVESKASPFGGGLEGASSFRRGLEGAVKGGPNP